MPNSSSAKYKNILDSGFTFIELLMAIVIMAFIFSIGFANYRGFQQRQHLAAAARTFKADLRYAQEQALAGTKPTGCTVLDAYRLSWVSSQSYDISAMCDAGANTVSVKTVDLSANGMYFDVAFTPVIFKVLGRGTNLSANLTIKLKDGPTSTNKVSIIITPGGEITSL